MIKGRKGIYYRSIYYLIYFKNFNMMSTFKSFTLYNFVNFIIYPYLKVGILIYKLQKN